MSENWTLKIADGVSESPWYLDFESCDEDGPLQESEFTGYILDANGTEVCSRAFPIANAHLIAAAPELWDALAALVTHDEYLIECKVLKPFVELERAKAALKKARGEA